MAVIFSILMSEKKIPLGIRTSQENFAKLPTFAPPLRSLATRRGCAAGAKGAQRQARRRTSRQGRISPNAMFRFHAERAYGQAMKGDRIDRLTVSFARKGEKRHE